MLRILLVKVKKFYIYCLISIVNWEYIFIHFSNLLSKGDSYVKTRKTTSKFLNSAKEHEEHGKGKMVKKINRLKSTVHILNLNSFNQNHLRKRIKYSFYQG